MNTQYKTPLHFLAIKPLFIIKRGLTGFERQFCNGDISVEVIEMTSFIKCYVDYLRDIFKRTKYITKLEDFDIKDKSKENLHIKMRDTFYGYGEDFIKGLQKQKNELQEFLQCYRRISKKEKQYKKKVIRLLHLFRILFYCNGKLTTTMDFKNCNKLNYKYNNKPICSNMINLSKIKMIQDYGAAGLEISYVGRKIKTPRILNWEFFRLDWSNYTEYKPRTDIPIPVIKNYSEIPVYIEKIIKKINWVVFKDKIIYLLTYLKLPSVCIRMFLEYV